jgi:hypothetical protein
MTDETIGWFAGVDWGSEQHQVCILDGTGKVKGERAFAHSGAGLVALCDWLVSVAGSSGSAAVAIEVPHGPVVDALQDRGFAVHAINPKQLDRLRDRFSVAGAKDDRRDARIAAAGLRTDPQLFRPVRIGDPMVVELREWSRLAAELQQERVRQSYSPAIVALLPAAARTHRRRRRRVGPGAVVDGTDPSESGASTPSCCRDRSVKRSSPYPNSVHAIRT